MNWKRNSSESSDKKPLVIISGPTAAGKTDLSVGLAKAIGGEIISADSMQVYKRFDIGTAKIRPDEMQGVNHYLIDIFEPDQEFNVFVFKKLALEAMDQIYQNGHIPIIVGGTGFYIQSVLYDIDFTEEETDKDYRHMLEEKAKTDGADALHAMLQAVDPDAAEQIHANNIKRTIRALEYYHETGFRISEHNEEQRKRSSPYNFVYFVLNRDRKTLYERINLRVDEMIEEGLENEVKDLLSTGVSSDSLAMQGLGYKEMAEYLEGKCEFEKAIYNIKIGTRHFAKRQLTWFRRERDIQWMNYEVFGNDKSKMLEEMIRRLKEASII